MGIYLIDKMIRVKKARIILGVGFWVPYLFAIFRIFEDEKNTRKMQK